MRPPTLLPLVICATLGFSSLSAAQESMASAPAEPPPQLLEDINTAVGLFALSLNTGLYNAAVGLHALRVNTGSDNSAIGGFALDANSTGYSNTASGKHALGANTTGYQNSGHGAHTLFSNTTGANNTASGIAALTANTTGSGNTGDGAAALYFNQTGNMNTAVGYEAGAYALGSYNVFLGASVGGIAADTNTIRIGLPYESVGPGTGQNQTFIAGIYGTQLTGTAHAVFIDSNGQLGTVTPGVLTGGGTVSLSVSQLEQQVRDQESVIADLQQRLARLEALMPRARQK